MVGQLSGSTTAAEVESALDDTLVALDGRSRSELEFDAEVTDPDKSLVDAELSVPGRPVGEGAMDARVEGSGGSEDRVGGNLVLLLPACKLTLPCPSKCEGETGSCGGTVGCQTDDCEK